MDNSLSLYLRSIGQYPLLNKEQELELGRRIKDEGDQEAREKLICCNLRLVVSIAKPFRNNNHNIPLDDLIMEGNLGLITAVDKYDYTYGYRFSTCAVPWIKQAIMKSIVDKSRTIRIPAHIVQAFNQYRDALDKLASEGNSNPTDEEVAAVMKKEVGDIAKLKEWRQNSVSLSTPLGDDSEDTLEDVCADESEMSPSDYARKGEQHDFVQKLLAGLDDRTRRIFKLRFGLGVEGDPQEYFSEHTLEEIGDLITPAITRERVRQIVAQQIAKWKVVYGDRLDILMD